MAGRDEDFLYNIPRLNRWFAILSVILLVSICWLVWDDYSRHLEDEKTLDLCRRVHTAVDAKAEAEFPANLSAAVRIVTKRGAFEAFVAVPKGEPGNFLSATCTAISVTVPSRAFGNFGLVAR